MTTAPHLLLTVAHAERRRAELVGGWQHVRRQHKLSRHPWRHGIEELKGDGDVAGRGAARRYSQLIDALAKQVDVAKAHELQSHLGGRIRHHKITVPNEKPCCHEVSSARARAQRRGLSGGPQPMNRRPLAAFVERTLMHGVCGVPAGDTLTLFNWTTSYPLDCSLHSNVNGKPVCYRVDRDEGNDAEPWQELEHILYERWLLPSSHVRLVADESRADLIVVPSALAHCRSSRGWHRHEWWNPAMVDGRRDLHDAYWSALYARDRERAAIRVARNVSREQWMLIHYDGTWQMEYGLAMLAALARQPSSFVRRLVLASIESPMQIRAHARAFGAPRAAPTFVSLPFAILLRDEINAAAEPPAARPIALLFSGRPSGSFDGSRAALHQQMVRMGARCIDGRDRRVTCTICAPGRADGCARAFEQLQLQSYHDPSVFGALKVLALASQSTLCLEPTSDTLVRSHTYAAILAGCVPVLFDTTLPFHPHEQPYRTEWAWRVGPSPRHVLNYSRFSVVEEAMPLVRGERSGLLPSLIRLATDPAEQPRLRALQTALACEAAPRMRYAVPADELSDGASTAHSSCRRHGEGMRTRGAGVSRRPPDAFAMLVRTAQAAIRRARAEREAVLPLGR